MNVSLRFLPILFIAPLACSARPGDSGESTTNADSIGPSASLRPVEFCGDGVDQDGDGSDLTCDSGGEGYPSTRVLDIFDRGAAEGIRVPQELSFPADSAPFVRLVNHSSFQVNFSGNLTAGWLEPNTRSVPDEITLSVGAPGRIQLYAYAGEEPVVRLVREKAPPGSGATVVLLGTAKQSGFGRMKAEIRLIPDGDPACPESQGTSWPSAEDCVHQDSCTISLRATVRLTRPDNGELINEYTILPPQCGFPTTSYHSTFSWASEHAGADYFGSAQWPGGGNSLHLSGSPAGLKGSGTVLTAVGDFDLKFAGAE